MVQNICHNSWVVSRAKARCAVRACGRDAPVDGRGGAGAARVAAAHRRLSRPRPPCARAAAPGASRGRLTRPHTLRLPDFEKPPPRPPRDSPRIPILADVASRAPTRGERARSRAPGTHRAGPPRTGAGRRPWTDWRVPVGARLGGDVVPSPRVTVRNAGAGFAAHERACRERGARPEHADDLFLAWSVAQGDAVALRRFDELVRPDIEAAARRLDRDPAFLDEGRQALRVRLLVAPQRGRPRI